MTDDSFKFNTPNKVNILPGQQNIFTDSDGFCSACEFVSSLESYSRKFQLPVVESCEVLSVLMNQGSNDFTVCVSENDSVKYYVAKQVVVASGGQNRVSIPDYARNISNDIFQLHVSEYKNSSKFHEWSFLIVGSAPKENYIVFMIGKH